MLAVMEGLAPLVLVVRQRERTAYVSAVYACLPPFTRARLMVEVAEDTSHAG